MGEWIGKLGNLKWFSGIVVVVVVVEVGKMVSGGLLIVDWVGMIV